MRDLNAMGHGDQVAKSMGVDVSRTRTRLILVSSSHRRYHLLHRGHRLHRACRTPHHPSCHRGDNRFLLPASGLVGGALLLTADSLARTILAPSIIPVGIMTAFIGIPFFLYLFLRQKEGYW